MYSLTKKRAYKKRAGWCISLKDRYVSNSALPAAGRVYTYELGGYLIICDDDSEICISYHKLRKYYV